tara:strand:- start:260666 stop:261274 length:609 start_codon:yes stop_codon:yes gene_type:complete
MKINQFVILALLILVISCEKEESSYTEVSGVVYEQGTNNTKTVANALVELQWRIPSTYGAETFFLDSVRTDENGRFKLSADTPSENLYVFASAYRHFPGGKLTMMPNVKRGQNQKVDIELTPYSWIKLNIHKSLGNDYIRINSIPGGNYGYFSSSNDVYYSTALGNRTIEISCFRIKDGIQSTAQYYVNTIGQDTVEVTIEF